MNSFDARGATPRIMSSSFGCALDGRDLICERNSRLFSCSCTCNRCPDIRRVCVRINQLHCPDSLESNNALRGFPPSLLTCVRKTIRERGCQIRQNDLVPLIRGTWSLDKFCMLGHVENFVWYCNKQRISEFIFYDTSIQNYIPSKFPIISRCSTFSIFCKFLLDFCNSVSCSFPNFASFPMPHEFINFLGCLFLVFWSFQIL